MRPLNLRGRAKNLQTRLRTPRVIVGPGTPVLLICRDRLTPLSTLVTWLEAEGFENISFIDNDSTFPPLLDYFDQTPHRVVRLRRNVGHHSPWLPEVTELRDERAPYVVSDPDVIPEDGAEGAVARFADLLNRYPGHTKAGFGLRIDDLPEGYAHRESVVRWEAGSWQKEVEPGVFQAPIDTTFALYRPGSQFTLGPALRTGAPYMARHEPWYRIDAEDDPELRYYYAHAKPSVATWQPTSKDSMYDDGDTSAT